MQRMSQLALLEDLNDSGGKIDGELTHTGFAHPNLQRGHPEMLHMIKREFCCYSVWQCEGASVADTLYSTSSTIGPQAYEEGDRGECSFG